MLKECFRFSSYNNDLKYESKRSWHCSYVTLIPAVIGALGTVSKDVRKWIDKICPIICFGTLQEACPTETAKHSQLCSIIEPEKGCKWIY